MAAAIALDFLNGLWLVLTGVILTLDCVHKRMGASFVFLAVVLVYFIAAIVFRNYWGRQMTIAQRELLKKYEEYDRKLVNVALAAVALMINIEHGCPPRLDALKRELAALQPEGQYDGEKE